MLQKIGLICGAILLGVLAWKVYDHIQYDKELLAMYEESKQKIIALEVDKENLEGKIRGLSAISDLQTSENSNLNSVLQETYDALATQTSELQEIDQVMLDPTKWLFKKEEITNSNVSPFGESYKPATPDPRYTPTKDNEVMKYEQISPDQNVAGINYLHSLYAAIN